MEGTYFKEAPKFNSPEEEIKFLRDHIENREKELRESGTEKTKEQVTKEALTAYDLLPKEEILHKNYVQKEEDIDAIVLRLKPEAHDEKISELYGYLLENGLKNTLDLVSRMNDPHIEDDFHRFLVQFLHASGEVPGLREGSPEFKSLNLALFEVTLPGNVKEEKKTFVDFITGMKQFLLGMQSISRGENNKEKQYYTLEIANSANSNDLVIYVSIPKEKRELLEKQVLAFYHDAKVKECVDDYNIFSMDSSVVASYASLSKEDVFPITTYEDLGHDPMSAVLNAFSKLEKVSEGAAIQIVVTPVGDGMIKKFSSILEKVKKGEKLKDAMDEYGEIKKELKNFAAGIFAPKKIDEDQNKEKDIDSDIIEAINIKLKSTIVDTNIRIVASAQSKSRAEDIASDIESSFEQFNKAKHNSFKWNRVGPKDLSLFLHNFSFRLQNEKHSVPLNLEELSTIFHFPISENATPELKESKAGQAPAPTDMGDSGVLLGKNIYRGKETPILMDSEDRMRHFYVIGQTGTGKTTILKNMIAQDIRNGHGCCFIDPHGTDVQEILSYVPKERMEDVIYFDPSFTERPMGLNMLEFDSNYPEQKTFVINELMGIFNKLFDMKVGGGAMFEQYFRNSTGLVMEHPESGNTLLEIGRVLSDKKFRDMKLANCKNPLIKQFWKSAEATSGEQGLENFVPYITSKFDGFLSNEIMRPIVTQEKSAFNFREIMDNKKILLVNLAKGRLGEINSNLIGMILVGKLQMAALSRVDLYGKKMNDFYLYIDEFQNVTTDSISSILSEARKYRLSLNMAHQYIAQLEDGIRDAVFGNVGSMAVYRVSPEDAEFLEKKFQPIFTATDITKLDNFNSYVNMLLRGTPTKPFSMECHWSIIPSGDKDMVDSLKQLSYLKFGRPRAEVENEILEKFEKM
ncbi:MAG: hypothetical protein QG580_11 [Patescibacteria group bacterium]|jgi:hypothetical protein|nr:hypothetical protein [Patescibacteria group bacterium]